MPRSPFADGPRPAHRARPAHRRGDHPRSPDRPVRGDHAASETAPAASTPVHWSAFRATVQYDPAHRMLVAVPAIASKRAQHPWLGEATGLPEQASDGRSFHRDFREGTVVWTPRGGACALVRRIADRWSACDAGDGPLGFPVTDVHEVPGRSGAHWAHFEYGTIVLSAVGAVVLHGMVLDIGNLLGAQRSTLGLPVGDVVVHGRGADTVYEAEFERGGIRWSAPLGAQVTVHGSDAASSPAPAAAPAPAPTHRTDPPRFAGLSRVAFAPA